MRQVNSVIRCYVARIILFVIVSTLLNHHEFLCMLALSKLHGILSSNRSMLLLLIAKAAVIVTKLLSLKKSQRKTSPFRVCCLHMNNDNPNCMRCEDWEMRLFVTKLLLLAPFHGPGFFYYANELSICRTRAIGHCTRISRRMERKLFNVNLKFWKIYFPSVAS